MTVEMWWVIGMSYLIFAVIFAFGMAKFIRSGKGGDE